MFKAEVRHTLEEAWLQQIEYVKNDKTRIYNSLEARQILNKLFMDHTSKSKETKASVIYSVAAYREEDSSIGYDKYYDYLREYRDSNILKYFGITFIEWMNLPYNRNRAMYEIGKQYFKEEIDIQEKSMKNMDMNLKGSK